MSTRVEEDENTEIGRLDEPARRRTASKKMLVVAVILILIVSIVGVAFVAGLFSEPEPQYETLFEEVYTYDGMGMWWEDRFFWLSWSPDGTHLTSYMGFSRVAIWDISAEPVTELEPHDLPVSDPDEVASYYDIEYHPIDDVIAVGWHQGIAFFDSEWNLLSEIRGGIARSIAWTPTGGLITANWEDHETGNFSLQAFLYPNLLSFLYQPVDRHYDVLEYSPNGAWLVGCGRGPILSVFDTHLQEKLRIPKYGCDFSVSWSPDSSALLLLKEGEVVLFDWRLVEEEVIVPRPSDKKYCDTYLGFGGQASATSAAFSPAGDMIAVSYTSGIVRIWSGDGKELLDTLLFRPCVNNPVVANDLYTAIWSPSGDMVAVSGEHGITVWKSK